MSARTSPVRCRSARCSMRSEKCRGRAGNGVGIWRTFVPADAFDAGETQGKAAGVADTFLNLIEGDFENGGRSDAVARGHWLMSRMLLEVVR